MIETSAKTTSILAVAIAAILALCAVSGAVVYNSTHNSNTTDSGDIPVSPVAPVTPVIDDRSKATALPSSSSDLVTMLSKSGENENALLKDRLANNTYIFNGSTYTITSNDDVAKYLYTLGYTVAGNNLAAKIDSQNTVVADSNGAKHVVDVKNTEGTEKNYIGDDSDDSSYTYEKLITKEDLSDDNGANAAIKKKKARLAETATETSTFASLKDLTVKQFTSGSWVTDVESRMSAYYVYFVEFADRDSTVLNAMMGTPFSLDGKIIKTVEDADDLAQMLYASGYEVVGSNLVADTYTGIFTGFTLAPTSSDKYSLPNVDDDALACMSQLSGLSKFGVMGVSAVVGIPFYNLEEITVDTFIGANLMMNEVKKAQASSDLEITASLSNTTSQKALVVAQYIAYTQQAASLDSDSSSATAALELILGTPFMNKNNEIEIITDVSTLADFFESNGIVVMDSRAVYCTFDENDNGVIMTASLNGMKAKLAYDILLQNNCVSRSVSLEDIENAKEALEEVIKEKEVLKGVYYITDMDSFCYALNDADDSSLMISALNGSTFCADGKEITLDSENLDSFRLMMTGLGFKINANGNVLIDGSYEAIISSISVGDMLNVLQKISETDVDEDNNDKTPTAPAEPAEVKKIDTFYDVEGLVTVLGYCENPTETTAANAIIGYVFGGETEITNEEIAYECLDKLFEGNGKEFGAITVSGLLEKINAMGE